MKFNDYNIRQRFSIRKYSFGACSVLLGLALLGVSQNVSADELTVSNSDTSVVATTGVTGSSEATSTDNASEKATTDATSETASSAKVTTDTTSETASSEKATTDTTSDVRSEVSASSPNISVSASVADKTTEGYTVTVDQVTEKDNSVASGDAITNTITLTTTEPHTLSADAYIKQTVTVDGTHTALKPTTIGLTDGSNNGEAQSTSGDEVSVLKLNTGAISSGSVRQFSSNVRLDSLATGQNITVLYELYDKGVLLASKSLEYAVENKKSDYSTNKTSNEFLTKFNTDETVKSTQPLHVGIYQNTAGITYQYGEITGTLPDGMTLTSDAIAKGWTQNGNTITRKFIQSDVSSTFVKPTGWENAGNNDLSYQGIDSSSLSLDTSKYGTYSELRDGKAYTIPFSVKLYSETGSSYTTDTSVNGTLRTSDKGIASGTGAGSAIFTANNKTEYKDNVLNPSSVQVSFTQGASQDTLNSGGSFSFADGIEYHLDANNAIKDYSVELVRASANNASSSSELDKISFDVYSLDTNEKLGSFKFNSGNYGFFAAEKNAIKIPDSTKGIKFVPTGDVTEFSTSTIQSLGAIFKITPTNQKQLQSDYESNGDTLVSKFTSNVVGASGVEANLQYTKVASLVSTGLYHTEGQLTSSGKNYGAQQMELLIRNTEDNTPINTTISKLTNDTANLILTVPDTLTVSLSGKEYTNGTFTIPMNTLKYEGLDGDLKNRIPYEIKANADSADGRYELSWAFEWSKASDEVKSLVSGVLL